MTHHPAASARLISNIKRTHDALRALDVPSNDILGITIDKDLDLTVDTKRGSLALLPNGQVVTVNINAPADAPDRGIMVDSPGAYVALTVPLLPREADEIHLSPREFTDIVKHVNAVKERNNIRLKLIGTLLLAPPLMALLLAFTDTRDPNFIAMTLILLLGAYELSDFALPYALKYLPRKLKDHLVKLGVVQVNMDFPESLRGASALNSTLAAWNGTPPGGERHTPLL